MKRIYSSVPHAPASGQFGDCFRAVIASLLDQQLIDDVPHFFATGSVEAGYRDLDDYLKEWFGLCYVETRLPGDYDLADILDTIGDAYPDLYVILGGRTLGANHVVIVRNGEIVHNPSVGVSNSLIGPTTEGYYTIGFLVSSFHK